jgi:5-methylcytosine-specific restriction endonuclease McrA
MECSKCGAEFAPPPRSSKGGRPRRRCDRCRTNIEKVDGVQWRALRLVVLSEEPYCAQPGCRRPATEVDHIRPLSRGGDAYDRSNLRAICKSHNSSKGSRMLGGRRTRSTPPAVAEESSEVVGTVADNPPTAGLGLRSIWPELDGHSLDYVVREQQRYGERP